ncbi:MAG: hypothetical protein ABSG34_00035 [Candidatus Sulfotelmatobacter sp.]|jgi:hypothetical protein
MSDPTPVPPPVTPTSPAAQSPSATPSPVPPPAPSGPTIRIGEEFGTAKKNLPPVKIVLIAVAGVLVLVLIASFLKRAKPQGGGSLDNVVAVQIPDQTSTMVALTFTIRNTSEKAFYVRTLGGSLQTADGESKADAVSAVDFDRYYEAFPMLKNGALPALMPEAEIPPGGSKSGTIIVAFPVALDAFNQRKSVSVVIWPYNETVPVVLGK